MPAISMSAVEVLPELLRFFETEGKEGKRQNIRPIHTQEVLGISL